MTEYRPITGKPCDSSHPYPTPTDSDWVDSMEYGDDDRLPGGSMWDRDSTPIWRAVAANMWNQRCYEQHLAEVAADPILTTHAMAITILANEPGNRDAITQLGFAQAGATQVFMALQNGGQTTARQLVDLMPDEERVTALGECVAHINHGFTAMRLDVGARFGG